MSDSVLCPDCGSEYRKIGNHWQHNDHRPDLTKEQREITTGLLMGDGCLGTHSENPFLIAQMTTPEYLEYLDMVFGVHGTGVSLSLTGEEVAKRDRESGFNAEADYSNYQDVYRWSTRTHPDFHNFDWYTGVHGEKVWPSEVELTPTVLKHWYVCDGHFDTSQNHERISIAASNEFGNTAKLDAIFQDSGLPTPSGYRTNEREDGSLKFDIRFSRRQTEEMFEYMGDPLPGFQYKFP